MVLKQLKAKGIIETVRVRVKDALPRELEKYYAPHITRQSMATLMREHERREAEDIEGCMSLQTWEKVKTYVFTGIDQSAIAITKKEPKTSTLSMEFIDTP